MEKKYKIVHDVKNCIGDFVCTTLDPEHWKENQDKGLVDLAGAEKGNDGNYELLIGEAELKNALESAKVCPVSCIHIIDLKTGKQLI